MDLYIIIVVVEEIFNKDFVIIVVCYFINVVVIVTIIVEIVVDDFEDCHHFFIDEIDEEIVPIVEIGRVMVNFVMVPKSIDDFADVSGLTIYVLNVNSVINKLEEPRYVIVEEIYEERNPLVAS